MLNTQSPIPLYRQLADVLSAEIESGVHEVDNPIPSEHALADRFAIGRPTVRQATDLRRCADFQGHLGVPLIKAPTESL